MTTEPTRETAAPAQPVMELPQTRSQSQPLPNENVSVPLRELDENEARLARENYMTPAQYLAWLEVDSDKVVDHKDPENE